MLLQPVLCPVPEPLYPMHETALESYREKYHNVCEAWINSGALLIHVQPNVLGYTGK